MELRQLRYFVCVAEELHFGRAAERLRMSQPPLSQQIKALENELGVQLFARTSRQVHLTEAGGLFLKEARRTLEQADHAKDIAQRTRLGEIGELAIGFTTATPFVPEVARALFEFRTAFPAIRLKLTELPRDAQLAQLAERQLDISFVRGFAEPILPTTMVRTLFIQDQLIVALRADHPLAARETLQITDLEGEPLVLYEKNMGAGFNDHLVQLCHECGFEPQIAQEANGLASLLGLVAAGFGMTILAESLSSVHLDNVVYRSLENSRGTMGLWVVHLDTPSSACQRFMDMIHSLPPSRRPG